MNSTFLNHAHQRAEFLLLVRTESEALVNAPRSGKSPASPPIPSTEQSNIFSASKEICPRKFSQSRKVCGKGHCFATSTGGAYPEIEIDDGTVTRSGHRWIAPATVEPQYDDDGNLEQDGRWTYHWDAEHRLVKLETLATAIAAGAPALTIEYTNSAPPRTQLRWSCIFIPVANPG